MGNEALEQLEKNRAQARRSELDSIAEVEASIANAERFYKQKQTELNEASQTLQGHVGRRAVLLRQVQYEERLHAKTVRGLTPEPVGPKIHGIDTTEEPKLLCPACGSHLTRAIVGSERICNACGCQFLPNQRNKITRAGTPASVLAQ